MTDWREWHRAYDDSGSSLSRRLEVVRTRLRESLDMVDGAEPRLLSLCSGDGRDVIPVLAAGARSRRVTAVLVESDPVLAERATTAARREGLRNVEVRCADASDPEVFGDALPVDVLMLCGIFGNVEPAEVRRLIASVPALLAAEGLVIWTRGRSDPDRRPEVRSWFAASGFRELAFSGEPESYGVGLHQLVPGDVVAQATPTRPLFTFRREADPPPCLP